MSLGQLPLPQVASNTASPQLGGRAGGLEPGARCTPRRGWVLTLLSSVAGCAPSLGGSPKNAGEVQVRDSRCGKQAAAAPWAQCQPELGAISDACLVTLNPAIELDVCSISLEGTMELVASFSLTFFYLGPGVASTSPSHPQWVPLLREHYEPFLCMENHFMADEKTEF